MLPTVLWLPRRKLLQLVPDSPSQADRFRAASEDLFNWSTILSGYLFSHSSDTPSSVPCSVQKAFEESPFPPTAHKVARQLGIDSEGGAWHETFYLEFYHGLFLCSFCFSLDSHQMGAWDQRLWANILTSLSYEGDHHSHWTVSSFHWALLQRMFGLWLGQWQGWGPSDSKQRASRNTSKVGNCGVGRQAWLSRTKDPKPPRQMTSQPSLLEHNTLCLLKHHEATGLDTGGTATSSFCMVSPIMLTPAVPAEMQPLRYKSPQM